MNKAAIIVAVSMLLSRVLGIFREMLLPSYLSRFSRAIKSLVTSVAAGNSSATCLTRSGLYS